MRRDWGFWLVWCGLMVMALALMGCSEKRPAHDLLFPQRAGAPCVTRNPPSMGECVAQHFGERQPRETLMPSGRLCEDWSKYQGDYPSTAGLACVMIQSNFGSSVEPSFASQSRDAHEHGVPCGVYTFQVGDSGRAEAEVAVREKRSNEYCHLGAWADAEVGAAYAHTCEYVSAAIGSGIAIDGMYTAPGLWPGGRCRGLLWPAEWEAPAPYGFAGYGSGQIALWQFSDGGGTVDRDRDEGVIALSEAHAASRHGLEVQLAAHRSELARLARQRTDIRGQLERWGCRTREREHRVRGPKCKGAEGAGQRVDRHIEYEQAAIRGLEKQLG